MAISVTPGNIRPLKGAAVRRKKLSAALSAGALAYVLNTALVAKADKGGVLTAHARGIVIADGYGSKDYTAGQMVDMVVSGPVGGFAGLTPGLVVYVDANGAPTQTLPTVGFVSIIGYAEDESTIFVQPQATLPVAAA